MPTASKKTATTPAVAPSKTKNIVSAVVEKVKPKVASKAIPKASGKVHSDFIPSLAELNAMPESEYMTAPQLRYFKSVLDGMRTDILINSDATSENLRENVVVPDPADRATIEEEHAIELRTRDRERKLLKKITQALEAIEQGEYGWCEETGDAIGLRRLLARPTATLSLEAQQRRELKQKMYGD
jgi:DnaK suppressor protein